MRFRIIGNGAFGTALSVVFKNNMLLEDSLGDQFEHFQADDVIVPAVPSDVLVHVMKKIQHMIANPKQVVLLVSKGVASDQLLHEMLRRALNCDYEFLYFIGPNFAQEIMNEVQLLSATVAGPKYLTQQIKKFLSNVIVDETTDLILPQIAGVIKNITAFTIGYIHPNENGRASLIMHGMREARILSGALSEKLDVSILSSMGSNTDVNAACFGDFVLTCISEKSRNFRAGQDFKAGNVKSETQESMKSADNIMTLKKDLKLPLVEFFYDVLKGNEVSVEKLNQEIIDFVC